jgi:hypothetical protein
LLASVARSAADSPAHVHEQASATESPASMFPVAVPLFWHTLPSAPVVQGQVPQVGFVPSALPKPGGSEEMPTTHQFERSWFMSAP